MIVFAFSVALTIPAKGQSSIQGMIDNTSPNGTLTIPAGTYYENIVITKPMTIQGSGVTIHAPTVTINNTTTMSGDVIHVTGFGVHITGLTLIGGASGINLDHAQNCVISDVNAHSNIRGVYLAGSSNNLIKNCDLSNNGYGVYGDYASHNTITTSKMTGAFGGSTALGDGIFFNFGDSNTVKGNTLSDNNAFGISCTGSSDNQISGNTISNNIRIGARFGPGANNNQLFSNTISSNGVAPSSGALASTFPACGVLVVDTAFNNRIYNNTFINQQIQISGSNYLTTAPATTAANTTNATATAVAVPPLTIAVPSTDTALLWVIIALVAIVIILAFVFIFQYYRNGGFGR
jgi:nitrous oxidase accessory protein